MRRKRILSTHQKSNYIEDAISHLSSHTRACCFPLILSCVIEIRMSLTFSWSISYYLGQSRNLTIIVYIESNAYSTSNECMTEKIYDVFAGMRRSVLFAKKCGNCQLESMPLNYTDRYKYRVSYPYFLFWHKHAVSKCLNKDVSVQRM